MNAPTRPGTVLKISFEHVSAIAHPEYYCPGYGTHPFVAADQVPDEHWTHTERTDDGPDAGGRIWAQYDSLLRLAAEGELIRNVYVCQAWPALEWTDITPERAP